METRRILFIVGSCLLLSATLLGIILVFFFKPCDYLNIAWGFSKTECSCAGIKIDTTCKNCDDAGGGNSCLGIITEKKCFKSEGMNITEYDCN